MVLGGKVAGAVPCLKYLLSELALLWQIIANGKVIGLNEAADAAVEGRSQ